MDRFRHIKGAWSKSREVPPPEILRASGLDSDAPLYAGSWFCFNTVVISKMAVL